MAPLLAKFAPIIAGNLATVQLNHDGTQGDRVPAHPQDTHAQSWPTVQLMSNGSGRPASGVEATFTRPIVLSHGMGDSCWNTNSMGSIISAIKNYTKTEVECVPTGNNQTEDTRSGYLIDLGDAIDVFAANVRTKTHLKNGFDAIGFSQGNIILRGYMQKYNDPPVNNFISVHGPLMGVSSMPHCDPTKSPGCEAIAHFLSSLGVYSEFVQHHLMQAGYYRDVTKVGTKEYMEHCRIARLNGEAEAENMEVTMDNQKKNFLKTGVLSRLEFEKLPIRVRSTESCAVYRWTATAPPHDRQGPGVLVVTFDVSSFLVVC